MAEGHKFYRGLQRMTAAVYAAHKQYAVYVVGRRGFTVQTNGKTV